ncbi:MAG TPA: hypothetical protein VG425_10230 [Casimicrobiaceae bacterium]|jgi:hypothetical protein|nr:hypothetical protein [Casimicrobiaceae bacterium]
MNRKPEVHVRDVPGIDLDYRPSDYFWALDANVHPPSGISGEARRKLFRARIEAGSTVQDGLGAELLDKPLREAWGRLDPRNMGGEYLRPLRKGEVEIARISLDSTTADQISIRARRLVGRIGFRIVDEYSSTYVCHPASSVAPLSLRELIALMETASDGGSIALPFLAMNIRDADPAELATFITVTSDFYADLGRFYRGLTDAWLDQRAREKSDES